MACADWGVIAALVRPTTSRPPAGTACTRWPSACGRSSASSASSRGWSWPASQPVRQDGPSPPRPAGAARLRHLSIRGMRPAPRSRDAGDSRRSCRREGPHGAVRYTAMREPTPIRQLVSDLQAVEDAGSDFSIISTTTSRGWRTRATRDTRGPCSGRPRRRPPRPGLRPIRPPPAGVSRAQRAEQARLGGKPGLPEGLREVPALGRRGAGP